MEVKQEKLDRSNKTKKTKENVAAKQDIELQQNNGDNADYGNGSKQDDRV